MEVRYYAAVRYVLHTVLCYDGHSNCNDDWLVDWMLKAIVVVAVCLYHFSFEGE